MQRQGIALLLLLWCAHAIRTESATDKKDGRWSTNSFSNIIGKNEGPVKEAPPSGVREDTDGQEGDMPQQRSASREDALGSPSRSTRSRRSARDWSKIDLDEVEEEWKDGDDEEELITPDEELYRLSERRREEAMSRLDRVMSEGAPGGGDEIERLAEEAQHAGKPGMIFAKVREDVRPPPVAASTKPTSSLAPRGEEGEGWDWDSLAEKCAEWKYDLEFKMVDITCYPMESELTILVTVQKGWNTRDVFDYLAMQGDVLSEVTWNDKTVRPKVMDDLSA